MPTYDELVKLLRQLVRGGHAVLSQQELQLNHETSNFLVALKQAQDVLVHFQPPAVPVTPADEEPDSVIHLYGPATSTAS